MGTSFTFKLYGGTHMVRCAFTTTPAQRCLGHEREAVTLSRHLSVYSTADTITRHGLRTDQTKIFCPRSAPESKNSATTSYLKPAYEHTENHASGADRGAQATAKVSATLHDIASTSAYMLQKSCRSVTLAGR